MLDCSAAVWLYPEGSYTHQTHTLTHTAHTHTKALFLVSSHGGMRAVHMSKPAASNIGDKAMHAVRINATSRAYNIKYESLEIYLVFGVWYSVSDVNVQAFDILYWEWEVTVALGNGYCLFRLCVFKWEMLLGARNIMYMRNRAIHQSLEGPTILTESSLTDNIWSRRWCLFNSQLSFMAQINEHKCWVSEPFLLIYRLL